MVDVAGIPEDMWTPFKVLQSVVEKTLTAKKLPNLSQLEIILQKSKPFFEKLLLNPPKNPNSRAQIRNGTTEGVNIPGMGNTVLSQSMVDESLILSDIYDLNEFTALQLLCSAESQMPNYPGLSRGLVAILLYYDGRKAVVNSLRDLFQITHGLTWTAVLQNEIVTLVTPFTTNLVQETNILCRIVDLVDEMSLTREMALLTKNRAVGNAKHHMQVTELFSDIKLSLATALFNWSAQRGLPKIVMGKLIQLLAKYDVTEQQHCMDDVLVTLLCAFLYSLDLSFLQRYEDLDEVVQSFPLFCEDEYALYLHNIIEKSNWSWDGRLKTICVLALGVCLSGLRQTPLNLQMNSTVVIEKDEQLVEQAIDRNVFAFIHNHLLESKLIFSSEFMYRRLHILFTDFIELMHSKVTEMRGRADETARTMLSFSQQGLDPPQTIDHNFENLMLSIAKFYAGNIHDVDFCYDYWEPIENPASQSRAYKRSVCLQKFIRLAGELLPNNLFVPYVKMLAGLGSSKKSAKHVFALLQHGTRVPGSNHITWDHFFSSLENYYTSLRQEQTPTIDTIYRSRALTRCISPAEIAGIHAVLEIIRAVSDYDEFCRMSLCQQPNWLVVQTFLGLLSCSIPLHIKSDIFKTLASLGKSVETAAIIWNNLEVSQIISTIPSTCEYTTEKIEVEIDQKESRNETYPLTQAFLDFFYTLCTIATPKNLGAGTRSPGLSPYLTFIIDKLFLGFYSKSYKNPREKWEVGEKCLKLLSFCVQSYDTSEDDGGAAGDQNTLPGYQVLIQMYTKSDTLKLILHILYEARQMLSTYSPFEGKEQLEACALHCLMIIEKALNQQEAFIRLHEVHGHERILSGLANLLMEINPRTGIPDHLISTTKFVVFAQWLPRHAVTAVRILEYMSKKPNTVQHLLQLFLQYDEVNNEIRQGFVDCLEDGGMLEVSNTGSNTEVGIKETIIKFLIETINLPAPNLAHYFLGYHVTKTMELTKFQQHCVVSKPTHCMKALIMLLDRKLQLIKHNDYIDQVEERIYYQAYNLLYILCLNRITSNFTLRLLRTSSNFFLVRHLAALPFPSINPTVLEQMSFLLRCVAIELKVSAQNNHISVFNNLFKILIGVAQVSSEDKLSELTHALSTSRAIPMAATSSVSSQTNQDEILLSALLNCVDFVAFTLNIPKWNYFKESLMKDVFEKCHRTIDGGFKIINLQNLHVVLRNEIAAVQHALTAEQRQLVQEEINKIMCFVTDMNEQKQKMVATVKFLEAWCQVAETLFIVSPNIVLPISTKQALLLDISQSLLKKVNVAWNPLSEDLLPELATLSADALLMLLVNLKSCYKEENQIQDTDCSMMISAAGVSEYSLPHLQKSNAASLKWILTNIIEWMINTGMSSQKLRVSLNASFLAFMHIINRNPKNLQVSNPLNHFDFVYRLDTSPKDQNEEKQITNEVLKSFGNRLVQTLCRDCTDGHAVCKILAVSSIVITMNTDLLSDCITYLSTSGHFAFFINDILKSDEDLCRIVTLVPGNLRELYVYEAKMGILCKIASNYIGAEFLLEENTIGVLSSMKVFDMHPDFRTNSAIRDTDMVTSIPPDIVYQQILYPATNFCMTILTTLGPENLSAHAHVLHFLLSHMDTVEMILRGGLHYLYWDVLKELNAVTAIICTTAKQEYTALLLLQNELPHTEASQLCRVQQLMLTLFSKFIVNEANVQELHKPENITYDFTKRNRSAHVRCFLETASNLALYCRNSIANHGADHRTIEILFMPTVVEVPQSFRSTLAGRLDVSPSISVVVAQLKCTVDYYNRQRKVHDDLVHQRSSVQNVSIDNTASERFDELSDSISDIGKELRQCAFISEHCLYILWAHLDFYMRRLAQQEENRTAIPFQNTNLSPSKSSDIFESSYEPEWNITVDEMTALKKTLISIFTETFCTQLLQAAQNEPNADRNYCESLLHRIKTLVQFSQI